MKKQWINIRFQFAVSLALASTDIAEELLTIIIMFFNQNNFWKRDEFEETRPVLPWAHVVRFHLPRVQETEMVEMLTVTLEL